MVIPVGLFLVGVVIGPFLGLNGWALGVLCTSFAAVAWWRAPGVGALWLLLASALLLGALLASVQLVEPLPDERRQVLLEGEIETVRDGPDGASWVVQVSRLDGAPARFRATLFAAHSRAVLPGQRFIASAKLKPALERSNPGEWSDSLELLRRGQVATGSVDGPRVLVLSEASWWRRWVDDRQRALGAKVESLDGDRDATALLLTLAAGKRAALDDAVEDEFARSGLAHILSVSGLHVAVLAVVVLALLRWVLVRVPSRRLRRIDVRRLAAPLAVPWVWAYVIFTGVQAPAVRSAVMCTLVLLGLAWQRRSDPLNALAIAAGAMAVLDPSAVFDLSVQLSFVAVAALILLSPLLREALPIDRPDPSTQRGWRLRVARAAEAVLQTFIASLAVTVASVPLVLTTFQRVGWAGLLSNVVALPLSGLLTLFSAGGAAVFVAAPSVSGPVLWLGIQLSKLLLLCAHLFAGIPGATVRLPAPEWWLGALWWAGLGALVFTRGRWRRLALAAPCAAVLHLVVVPSPQWVEVSFLAVGHGDAIVVSSRGHHLLVDGGGIPNGSDTGRRFVLPFLRQKRVDRLDLVVLSHPHPDHALGLISTLHELSTDRLWLPAGASEGPLIEDLREAAEDAEVDEVEAGHVPYALGEATVEVLGPPPDRVLLKGENDRSVVLRVRHGEVTFLLSGDIEEAAEEQLDPGPVTVMKAPHHGSRTSSSVGLLERAQPKFVVFCVGKNNRFGFPSPEVVARYELAGARCYRTDRDGAVTFRSDGHRVEVETFLKPDSVASAAAHDRDDQKQHHEATANE